MPCERCEKAGDLACVQFQEEDGSLTFAMSLRPNGSIHLGSTDEVSLLKLLGYLNRVWVQTSADLLMVLLSTRGQKDVTGSKAYSDMVEAGFLKLKYYGTMDGAVREWMRANGRQFPDDVMPATQKPGRA